MKSRAHAGVVMDDGRALASGAGSPGSGSGAMFDCPHALHLEGSGRSRRAGRATFMIGWAWALCCSISVTS